MNRRRGFDKIIQIHRRHGFGEIIQKIKILSATWFRRKTEEGSDAGNTDCGNRVDSKQRSVTACSTVQKIAGTFSPPCCLVFVAQDRQSWVPGPLQM